MKCTKQTLLTALTKVKWVLTVNNVIASSWSFNLAAIVAEILIATDNTEKSTTILTFKAQNGLSGEQLCCTSILLTDKCLPMICYFYMNNSELGASLSLLLNEIV